MPFIIYFVSSLIMVIFGRLENAHTAKLATLKAKQRIKVEELKTKTQYYATKNLLDRYEAETTPNRPRPQGMPAVNNTITPVPYDRPPDRMMPGKLYDSCQDFFLIITPYFLIDGLHQRTNRVKSGDRSLDSLNTQMPLKESFSPKSVAVQPASSMKMNHGGDFANPAIFGATGMFWLYI